MLFRVFRNITKQKYYNSFAGLMSCLCWFVFSGTAPVYAQLNKTGNQWQPIEWEVQNSSFSGNPFDVIAEVVFEHVESNETRRTSMFYNGGDVWKFRFTGTRPGEWQFNSQSDDPELNGLSGLVTVIANDNNIGFTTSIGNQWAHSATQKVFVPQFLMYPTPDQFYNKPGQIDNDIQLFLRDHGFNGFHTSVYNRWFDIDQMSYDRINNPEPDFRTFEALELLITKTYAAGGTVHIWMWGDEERKQTPKRWGINSTEDKRLQRYIAARLGPLPGWTMGYGFDLFEWVSGSELSEWHDYMQSQMGWKHFLGARSDKNSLNQISEDMDYSAYEQHKPDYNKYVETIERRPEKPAFSEDRFRVRNEGRSKDYNMEETRRGLWHSTMVGGVANIWGNLIGSAGHYSIAYPNPEQIKTWSTFFAPRFLNNMRRANDLTDGVCLKHSDNKHYVFYKENTSSIRINLSGMNGNQTVIAVDTKRAYQEINQGSLSANDQVWNAPYESDWAVAVGDFSGNSLPQDTTAPAAPTGVRIIE
jgi:hypothetical protein